jgi:hypothetical protein
VANGDLIVAALALGFPVAWDGVSPNVRIAVARSDAEHLDPEQLSTGRGQRAPTKPTTRRADGPA